MIFLYFKFAFTTLHTLFEKRLLLYEGYVLFRDRITEAMTPITTMRVNIMVMMLQSNAVGGLFLDRFNVTFYTCIVCEEKMLGNCFVGSLRRLACG